MADCYNGESNPEITVGESRGAAAIARDIERRFLPYFRKRWDVVAARARDRDEYDAKVQANRERICEIIEGARLSPHSEQEVWVPGYYFKARANSDSIDLELRDLPIQLVERLVGVIESWRREHGEPY